MSPIARSAATALALVALMGMSAWTATTAEAQSARVNAFAGHRLMEDPTDVFMFPGLLFENSDRLHIDFEPTAASGQGGLTFGESRILGVHVGRGMVRHHPRSIVAPGLVTLSDHDLFSSVFDGQGIEVIPQPGMMLDVLFGLPTGLGFRLSVTNSIVDQISTTTPAPDPPPNDVCGQNETGTEFRTIEVGAGWSQRTNDRSTDIGGAVSLHTVKRVTKGCLDAEAVGSPSVTAAARVAFRMSDRMELGVLGSLEIRDYSVEFSRKEGETEARLFSLTAGVGPRIKLSDKVTAVATAVVGMALDSGKVRQGKDAPNRETKVTRYILPGIDLALEAKWKDWLTARAGVLNRYTITAAETDTPAVGEGGVATSTVGLQTGAEHLAAAGVGIHWDGFAIDGSFNVPFLTDGPDFLGGRGQGVFGELSMTYAWGADEKVYTPSTPEVAPPPAPTRRRPEQTYSPSSPIPQAPPRYEPPPRPPSYEQPKDPYDNPR